MTPQGGAPHPQAWRLRGVGPWGSKEPAKRGDPEVFVNTDWDKCLGAMEAAGFRAEKEVVRLEGMASYIPLIGRKES